MLGKAAKLLIDYHVMSQANGKGNVHEMDVDGQDFIKTLAEACRKTGFQVHVYFLNTKGSPLI